MNWSDVRNQCKPLHNKDDVEYATGCMRKKPIKSAKTADKVATVMKKRHNKDFNGYKCKFCKYFHVGSLNEGRK